MERKATSPRVLSSLAADADALDDLDVVEARLRATTAESRFLEWKSGGLFGAGVTVRNKYRAVKAAISFANTDGGFIVFGVDPKGTWVGLTPDEMAELDHEAAHRRRNAPDPGAVRAHASGAGRTA